MQIQWCKGLGTLQVSMSNFINEKSYILFYILGAVTLLLMSGFGVKIWMEGESVTDEHFR